MIPVYVGEFSDKRLVALLPSRKEALEFVQLVNNDKTCQLDFGVDYEPVYLDNTEYPVLDLTKWKEGWRYYAVMVNHKKLTVTKVLRMTTDYEAPGVLHKVVFARTSGDAAVQVLPLWEKKNGTFSPMGDAIYAAGR